MDFIKGNIMPNKGRIKNTAEFYNVAPRCIYFKAQLTLQVERIRAEEAQRRQEMLAKRVIDEVMKEMNERRMDIKKCLDETRNALELLVPKFIPDDMPQSSTSCDDNGDQTVSDHVPLALDIDGLSCLFSFAPC